MIQNLLKSELLLNLVSREIVGWMMVKLVSSYKYASLLV
jgi:hypothetical protein